MYTNHDLYLITAKTSLHPGAGRSEFSTIDHQVQRDYRGFPVIRKSSMKGALKEYLKDLKESKYIFGGNYGEENKLVAFVNDFAKDESVLGNPIIEKMIRKLEAQTQEQTSAGQFSFHDASLFSIPVRSNVQPYFNVTSLAILKHFRDGLQTYEIEDSEGLTKEINGLLNLIMDKGKEGENAAVLTAFPLSTQQKFYLDDFECEADFIHPVDNQEFKRLSTWTDNNLLIAHHDSFKLLVDNFHLPIIPRNSIENGESKNLWYEQVLPPETRFYTYIGHSNEGQLHNFTEAVNEKIIGVGANLSVGYGCCYFENHKTMQDEKSE